MNLDQAQRQKVTAWIAEGLKLSDIQNRLMAEFGLKMTYMEVRFLVDDLKLVPKDPEPPKPVAPTSPLSAPGTDTVKPGNAPVVKSGEVPQGKGNVSVTVDTLTRPGSIVSGKVTFSDGNTADWYLDQTGRLGVVTKQQGYKPSGADVQLFQTALEKELAKMGI
jgi:hypothetical protein